MKVLVLNCGSSSVKYKLFDMELNKVLAQGLAERIGMSGSKFRHRHGEREVLIEQPLAGHREAVERILHILTHVKHGVIDDVKEIQAVGHRVVHGGEMFHQPVVVNNDVLELLEDIAKIAPLHNPPNIMGIRVCQKLMPHAVHVAVFDTAFHQTLPDYAYMYALPYEYYKNHKIRKYGFHGTSHKYVAKRAADISGAKLEELNIITCHLGNGASLCAVKGGKSQDTTMGFTPLAGLVMGTRCGDVDPAIISHVAEIEGISLPQITDVLNKKSGVLGVSGISSDFRDIEQAARDGHDRARLALDMFVYSVAKGVGSLLPALGRLDILVFTAGIGENSTEIRYKICSALKFLGIFIDEQRNLIRGAEEEISAVNSAVKVMVIPTDEEKMIAEETVSLAAKEHSTLVVA